jgi:hypothetical protein
VTKATADGSRPRKTTAPRAFGDAAEKAWAAAGASGRRKKVPDHIA